MSKYRIVGEIVNHRGDLVGFEVVEQARPHTIRRVLLSQPPPQRAAGQPVRINAKEILQWARTEGVPPAPDTMDEVVRLQRERGLRR